ncbi:MAG: glycosyltransferase, partial [Thiohalocapsa sp.]
ERDHRRAPSPSPSIPAGDPLVSIVLPVCNQAYLVDEAIAGVLSQTYPNWELIVVDDGSTDDLAARVRRHLGDRRMLLLRQPNRRLPAALNAGFARARGALLTWTSADNIMLPTQLERLVAALAAHPEAGLAYSDYWAIDECGEPLADPDWRHHNRDAEIADLIRLPDAVTIENFHRSGDNFIGASFLYRRAVADLVGSYADDTFGGEDYDFWLRLHLVTEFVHVAEPLYKYRVHADTLTARAADLGLYDNIRELLEADGWRLETLLDEGGLRRGEGLLRPTAQFHAAILRRCRPVPYGGLAVQASDGEGEPPLVVDLDVPLRMIDADALADALQEADLLLCRSALTAAWLRRQEWARPKRVLVWQGEVTPAVQHAYIQAFADQVTAPLTLSSRESSQAPARLDGAFRPSRILILVERWSAGGMESVVADLACSLAAGGANVTVASAHGAAPRAGTFAAGIRTAALRGDPAAFTALLRQERIEVVNYHHSRFGIGLAREFGAATVYTLHNCYLWMDDEARAAVGADLRRMDAVIAVSRQVAQFAHCQFAVGPERLFVVGNGLREDFVMPATRPASEAGAPFVIAMVASLTRPKLQHVAIAAFADAAAGIPALRLRLIGAPLDPQYQAELDAQIAASPCNDRIELLGGVSRRETAMALAAAHVFLLPSLVEGCSMALLEAAAAGCVAIASDVGSARDLLLPGGSVILLPSPLGELDRVTQQQFLAAAHAALPDHRANIAAALRTAWQDYGSLAAATEETRARLRRLADMAAMTEAYLDIYTLALRGGWAERRQDANADPDAAASNAIATGAASALA